MTVDDLQERVAATRRAPMAPVNRFDREEFAVALVLQGYDALRAHTMAFETIADNDGALQMLARRRVAIQEGRP